MPTIAARRAGIRRSRPLLTAVKLGNGPATSFGFGAEANQAFAFTVSTATTITRLDFHVLSGGPSSPTNITVGIADSTFSGGTITRANVPWVGAPGTMVWPNSSAQVLSVNVGPAACVPGTTYYIVLEGPTDASISTVASANGAPVVEGPVSLTGAYRYGTLAANNWLNTGSGSCPCVDIWGVVTGPTLNGKAIQHDSTTAATTTSLSLDSPTLTGDLAVVACVVGTSSVSSVTGLGATWSQLAAFPSSKNYELWIGTGCTAGNSGVTITTAASVQVSAMALTFSRTPSEKSLASSSTSGFTSPYVLPSMASTAAAQIVLTLGICGTDTGITWTDSPSAWTGDYTVAESIGPLQTLYARHIVTTASGVTYQTSMNHTNNDIGPVWTVLLGT